MIDDKQTCDVCGEEFNEERPHHVHQEKKTQAVPEKGASTDEVGDAETQE
jgi:hypothetical protein